MAKASVRPVFCATCHTSRIRTPTPAKECWQTRNDFQGCGEKAKLSDPRPDTCFHVPRGSRSVSATWSCVRSSKKARLSACRWECGRFSRAAWTASLSTAMRSTGPSLPSAKCPESRSWGPSGAGGSAVAARRARGTELSGAARVGRGRAGDHRCRLYTKKVLLDDVLRSKCI